MDLHPFLAPHVGTAPSVHFYFHSGDPLSVTLNEGEHPLDVLPPVRLHGLAGITIITTGVGRYVERGSAAFEITISALLLADGGHQSVIAEAQDEPYLVEGGFNGVIAQRMALNLGLDPKDFDERTQNG